MGRLYLSVNTARMEMLLGSWFPEQPIRGERPEVRERGSQRARDGWQLSRSWRLQGEELGKDRA